MPETNGVGAEFAAAIAAKDRTALLALLDDGVEFRALTPGRNWSADDAVTAPRPRALGMARPQSFAGNGPAIPKRGWGGQGGDQVCSDGC